MTDAAARREPATSATVAPEAMAWDSRRAARGRAVYLPLACFVFILLFPFYWMAITAFKPNAELYDYKNYNPFWIAQPTLDHIQQAAVPDRLSALAADHDDGRGRRDLPVAVLRACSRPTPSSGCASGAASMSGSRSISPTWCRRRSCSSRSRPWSFSSACSTRPLALILVYPTFLVPFCTWLLIGYFKSIPYELEECALIDGATRLQILRQITLPLAVPGPDLRRHLLLHAVLERVHLRARLHPEQREQDRAGRDPDRARLRRRLSVGRADGRIAARLAAGGDLLFVLRRLLRLLAHRRGEGVSVDEGASSPVPTGPARQQARARPQAAARPR